MRGSPLLRFFLVVLAMSALGVPLRNLTTHRKAGPPTPPTAESSAQGVDIQISLTSTKEPFHFEISHLGRPIWTGDATESRIEKSLSMEFPKEGIDLLINATWPTAGPAALKVEVTPPVRDTITKILWSDGGVSDVLTFQ